MANNTALNPGSGGDTIQTDDIGGGVKQAASKIVVGAAGAAGGYMDGGNGVSSAQSPRVTLASDSTGQVKAIGGAAVGAAPADKPVQVGFTDGTNVQYGSLASAANLANATPGNKAIMAAPPATWSATHAPGAAATPSVSKAAGGAGVRHVCKEVSFSIACGATAQTVLTANLRDGASGAGTILKSWVIACLAGSMATFSEACNCIGSPATAMTLEFSGATVANASGTVNLGGYDAT